MATKPTAKEPPVPEPADIEALHVLRAAFRSAHAGVADRTKLTPLDSEKLSRARVAATSFILKARSAWRGLSEPPSVVLELPEIVSAYCDLSTSQRKETILVDNVEKSFFRPAIESATIREQLVRDGAQILANISEAERAAHDRLQSVANRQAETLRCVQYWLKQPIVAPLLAAFSAMDATGQPYPLGELFDLVRSSMNRHPGDDAPGQLTLANRAQWLPILKAQITNGATA